MGSEVEMETDDRKECGMDPKVRALADKPRWTRKQAQSILLAQHKSGLSVQAFAKALGLNSWRLYKWRRQLGLERSAPPKPPKQPVPPISIVPLQLAAGAGAAAPAQSGAVRLELRHPCGLRIRFSHPPPESFLQHLLQILVPLC